MLFWRDGTRRRRSRTDEYVSAPPALYLLAAHVYDGTVSIEEGNMARPPSTSTLSNMGHDGPPSFSSARKTASEIDAMKRLRIMTSHLSVFCEGGNGDMRRPEAYMRPWSSAISCDTHFETDDDGTPMTQPPLSRAREAAMDGSPSLRGITIATECSAKYDTASAISSLPCMDGDGMPTSVTALTGSTTPLRRLFTTSSIKARQRSRKRMTATT